LNATYPELPSLLSAMRDLKATPTTSKIEELVARADEMLLAFHDTRVTSHLAFILGLSDPVALIRETRDFVADLISLNHSESFLFSWARARIIGDDVCPAQGTLAARLTEFADLGRARRFIVAFVVGPSPGHLPHSDIFNFGHKNLVPFTTLAITTLPGQSPAIAHVDAPDYKSAATFALGELHKYLQSLSYSRRTRRIGVVSNDIYVRSDDGVEITLPRESIRDYEPPAVTMGNSLWLCRRSNPALASALGRCLSWLGSSERVQGEAQFVHLWLALVTLFETDDVDAIVPPLAR